MVYQPGEFKYSVHIDHFSNCRPPSEKDSLLIRVSESCPHNTCIFCPVYKGKEHKVIPVQSVFRAIDEIRESYDGKHTTAFLQDADAIRTSTSDLIEIITKIYDSFPGISVVKTYGTTQSIAKKSLQELAELYDSGLSCIHRGLETGYDPLLSYMKKGTTQAQQIEVGLAVIASGIELSDYVMPGLGGNLSLEGNQTWLRHAEETAKVISKVNPQYVRLRMLNIAPGTVLEARANRGEYSRLSDPEIIEELRHFITQLSGFSGRIESDHNLNVLMEIKGPFPQSKERMLRVIDNYLEMTPEQQKLFRAGQLLSLFTEAIPHRYRFISLNRFDSEREAYIRTLLRNTDPDTVIHGLLENINWPAEFRS